MTDRNKTFEGRAPLPRDANGRLILEKPQYAALDDANARAAKVVEGAVEAIAKTKTGAPRTKWTLDQGLALVRHLEPLLASVGWHCGLAGGALHKGASTKDVDVIVFPHDSTKKNLRKLRSALRAAGMVLWRSREATRRHWRKQGSSDDKHVEIWLMQTRSARPHIRGGRVDVLVLS